MFLSSSISAWINLLLLKSSVSMLSRITTFENLSQEKFVLGKFNFFTELLSITNAGFCKAK